MKQYLTNEIIKYKNEYINEIFYIEKGTIIEDKTNHTFQDHSYLFLERIYTNPFTENNYIAKSRVTGKWLKKEELSINHIKELAQMYEKEKKHSELLQIKNPIIKISRYLYYEYLPNKKMNFYILSFKEISSYLNISLSKITEVFKYLINQNIISKHNKLIKILCIKKLEDNAYLLDY